MYTLEVLSIRFSSDDSLAMNGRPSQVCLSGTGVHILACRLLASLRVA
jgi:hypothetical protein